MGISLPLELLAMLLYIKALKVSPLTLTLPFLSLTPLYLLVTSFLLLGERVGGRGLAGILLLTVGGYVLNLGSIGSGLLEPFRSILREKGSLYMVFVSVLYSMTSALGKKAILLSSPLTFAFFYYPLLWISLGVFLCVRERGSLEKLTQRRGLIKALLPGLCNFLSIVFHVYGITLCLVPYFIALKRTSIIFGMIYGFFFFGEGQRLERLAGTLLMFSGLLMLIFP
jgi:drug/metabolite transporter (DMT)-like permease